MERDRKTKKELGRERERISDEKKNRKVNIEGSKRKLGERKKARTRERLSGRGRKDDERWKRKQQ